MKSYTKEVGALTLFLACDKNKHYQCILKTFQTSERRQITQEEVISNKREEPGEGGLAKPQDHLSSFCEQWFNELEPQGCHRPRPKPAQNGLKESETAKEESNY